MWRSERSLLRTILPQVQMSNTLTHTISSAPLQWKPVRRAPPTAHFTQNHRTMQQQQQHYSPNHDQQQVKHQPARIIGTTNNVSTPATNATHQFLQKHHNNFKNKPPQQQQHEPHHHDKRRKLPNFLAPRGHEHELHLYDQPNRYIPPLLSHSYPKLHRSPSAPQPSSSAAFSTSARSNYAASSFSTSVASASHNSKSPSPVPTMRSQSFSTGSTYHIKPVTYLPPAPKASLPDNYKVHYVQSREHANELAATLHKELKTLPSVSCSCPPACVGFDLEWKPTFVKGQGQNPVALLQLATHNQAFLFQLTSWSPIKPIHPSSFASHSEYQVAAAKRHAQVLGEALTALLLDDKVLKVGVGIKGDLSKFRTDYGLDIAGALELSDYANERLADETPVAVAATPAAAAAASTPEIDARIPLVNMDAVPTITPIARNWSLAALVHHTLDGLELAKPKRIRMSNWESYLSPQQQSYAAIDAYVGFAIFQKLHKTHQTQKRCTHALAVGRGLAPKSSYSTVEALRPIEITTVRRTSSDTAGASSSSSSSTPRVNSHDTATLQRSSSSSEVSEVLDRNKKRKRTTPTIEIIDE